jgi:hypothetical protein
MGFCAPAWAFSLEPYRCGGAASHGGGEFAVALPVFFQLLDLPGTV